MADRAPQYQQGGLTRVAAFARSVVLLVALVIGVPVALMWAARQRFGGSAPLHGVASPAEWRLDTVRDALTDRLTERTVADIVIRTSLVVAWIAVIVLVVTVVAEVVHMVRHDGLALPDVRGLGPTQHVARTIAAGLLIVVPLVSSPAGVLARETGPGPMPLGGDPAVELLREQPAGATTVDVDGPSVATSQGSSMRSHYTVRSGDSIYGIAERLVGPGPDAVAEYAERILELNLGQRMPDGRHFSNAAFVDVGWVLELPDPDAAAAGDVVDRVHEVERGETLWSIADDELGDPERWPELYAANEGRSFDDGRSLTDPDLIHPGWDLVVPGGDDERDVVSEIDRLEPAPVTHVVEPIIDPAAEAVPIRETTTHPEVESSSAETAVEIQPDQVGADEIAGRRAVVWPGADDTRTTAAEEASGEADDAPATITMQRAAMLSAGVLALLAVRRHRQLRRARPRSRLPAPAPGPSATERALRSSDPGERFARVEAAIRAAAAHLIAGRAQVEAVIVGPDGDLELRATAPVELPTPWHGGGTVWQVDASTPYELLAAAGDQVPPPCPTLVQLGTDDEGRDVYVDLEALQAVEIGGPGAQADAIVAALATTLAGSLLAEVTTLVGLGVPDQAFLDHRLFVPARDPQRAFEAAADAIGATASVTDATFALRAGATASETWEPAVVLVGASSGAITMPSNRVGLAVVSASPIVGPSSRLAPEDDAWVLQPAGIRLHPVGLSVADITAIAELVAVADATPDLDPTTLSEHTLVGADEIESAPADLGRSSTAADPVDTAPADTGPADIEAVDPGAELDHALVVTVLGGVSVVDRDGTAVEFERSKTRELVAWLATHRSRSTRSAARTALWELDVRDATFANVVSEARRSLARLVEPPAGEEWVGRTMTDSLPLHELVVTDADLVEHALEVARLQPPAQAIHTLTPAVAQITGVPFEGTSYLWPDSEGITSNLVLLATTATTELAAHCLSIGDIQGVFAATGRGLQVLPGHEELIALRMEAHARAGDHAGVRHEWESYERVINNDPWSDGEPAPKLVDLRRRLLQPDPTR